jgi:hypothetical protein
MLLVVEEVGMLVMMRVMGGWQHISGTGPKGLHLMPYQQQELQEHYTVQ